MLWQHQNILSISIITAIIYNNNDNLFFNDKKINSFCGITTSCFSVSLRSNFVPTSPSLSFKGAALEWAFLDTCARLL